MTDLEIKTGEEITRYVRFLSFGEALRIAENQRWVSADSLKPEHESIAFDVENLWRHNSHSGDLYQVPKRQIEAIRERLLGLLAEQKKEK